VLYKFNITIYHKNVSDDNISKAWVAKTSAHIILQQKCLAHDQQMKIPNAGFLIVDLTSMKACYEFFFFHIFFKKKENNQGHHKCLFLM
jgi:hypothetical protein